MPIRNSAGLITAWIGTVCDRGRSVCGWRTRRTRGQPDRINGSNLVDWYYNGNVPVRIPLFSGSCSGGYNIAGFGCFVLTSPYERMIGRYDRCRVRSARRHNRSGGHPHESRLQLHHQLWLSRRPARSRLTQRSPSSCSERDDRGGGSRPARRLAGGRGSQLGRRCAARPRRRRDRGRRKPAPSSTRAARLPALPDPALVPVPARHLPALRRAAGPSARRCWRRRRSSCSPWPGFPLCAPSV